VANKTYIQKLNNTKNLPKIIKLDDNASLKFGANTMVVPKPLDVYEIMKAIPKGKIITTSQIREALSFKYNADTACALTTGIFINISANASVEINDNMPYWRTLKAKGEINPKFPNAPYEQIAMLEQEGFEVIQKGVKNIRYFIKDYEDYLMLKS